MVHGPCQSPESSLFQKEKTEIPLKSSRLCVYINFLIVIKTFDEGGLIGHLEM